MRLGEFLGEEQRKRSAFTQGEIADFSEMTDENVPDRRLIR